MPKGRPLKTRKIKVDLPVEVTLSEIVKSIENVLKPFQTNLDVGIEKFNDTVNTITLNIKINL